MTSYAQITPYIAALSQKSKDNNHIEPAMYAENDVKRGLRDLSGNGVVTGLTEISRIVSKTPDENGVPRPCAGKLYYRGIDVRDFVNGFMREKRFGFEELTYLLLTGELPDPAELADFCRTVGEYRSLPPSFVRDMILKASSKNVMNLMSRSVLALYSYDENPDDISLPNVMRQSLQLISMFPLIAVYGYHAYRHYHLGQTLMIRNPLPELSTAENLLRILRKNAKYTEQEARILDLALVLHAEHGGGNNSTFTCRVLTSSGTDSYAAYSSAIGALKGPRHGGANLKVCRMLDDMLAHIEDVTDEAQVAAYLEKIIRKQAGDRSGLVYGMGHAVYTISDPRAQILKEKARKFAERSGFQKEFTLACLIEKLTPEVFRRITGSSKPLCANVDLYSGIVYKLLDIPEDLFTPLFASARIAGWSAHRMEELLTGGRIIRPAYKSVALPKKYVPISERISNYLTTATYVPAEDRIYSEGEEVL